MQSADPHKIIARNLADVQSAISAAAVQSGRKPEDIRLIAVTKYVGADLIQPMYDAGIREIGESRPQDLWAKASAMREIPFRWHLVGHLQRNKVRRTLSIVSLIQSVDSIKLLRAIDNEAKSLGQRVQVLLEANTSGDKAKHGFSSRELTSAVMESLTLKDVEVRGLMTMAARLGGRDEARRNFAALRELRDSIRPHLPTHVPLDELSMGMSGDFEEAILEGATMIRIGSALFEGLLN